MRFGPDRGSRSLSPEGAFLYTAESVAFATNPKRKRGGRYAPRLRFGLVWLGATVFLGVLVAGVLCGAEIAQTSSAAPPAQKPEEISAETIQQRLKQLEAAADLDDATKAKIRPLCEQALRELDDARKRASVAAGFRQMAGSAAEQLQQTKAALAAATSSAPVLPTQTATLQELESGLAQREEKLAKLKEKLAQLEAEPKRRATRRKEIPDTLNKARERLAGIVQQLSAPAAPEIAPAVASSERALALARRKSAEEEIAGLEQEGAAYEATSQLLPLERDLAAAELALAEADAARWRQQVNRCRQQEAQQQLQRARRAQLEAAEAHPTVRPWADENRSLAEKGEQLALRIKQASEELQTLGATLESLNRQFQRTQDKVEAVGLSNAIGLLLRTQRAVLPDVDTHQRAIRTRQPEIRNTQFAWFELEDRRSEMANLERQIEDTLADLSSLAGEIEPTDLENAVRDLLTSRRDLTDTIITSYNRYFDLLVELDSVERQLIRRTEQYAAYVDERVLWTASAEPLVPGRLAGEASLAAEAAEALSWLLSRQGWSDVGGDLSHDLAARPVVWLTAACAFGLLFYYQRWLRRKLAQIGQMAQQSGLYRLLPTFNALVLTVLISVLWPGLLWYAGWRLGAALPTSEFVKAISAGLISTAACYLPLELLRQLCRGKGVGEAHFGWPAGSLRMIGRNLHWFLLAILPLVFVADTLRAQGSQRLDNSLGRMCYIATLLLASLFMHRVLRPSGGLFRHILAEGREGWFYRFRHFWYAVGVLAPLGLAVLTAAGYYYTAHQLGARLRQTFYLPLAMAVLGAVFSRWVLVVRRKLAIQRSRQRRAAAQADGATGTEASNMASLPSPVMPEPDLTHVSAQTRRLLQSFLLLGTVIGIWFIWVDVLPALSVLDRLPLWPTTIQAAESITAADGSITTRTIERNDFITLADLALALVILLMTVIAARNIPGLLQISIPQRLPLDAGARYAITTISRYLIVILGLLMGCSTLGIGWSKVQWLLAAVSVGLGFGLQEIFANFVSGLILLFERPIRVGDIVTIDGVSGVVSRIQIRATTVTNWDRQEFIVPNKEFITGRLLNWTLADKVNRVVINVGIAYGSDTDLACHTLRRIAEDHPAVLKDPPPMVSFEGFGDSALNLVLRCFLPNLDNRTQVVHDLHTTIHRQFEELGIEIPFPQRDLHIRTPLPPHIPNS